VANGRRDLIDGSEGAERTLLVSITMTKFRLSSPTVHAEIAYGWITIFGAQKSGMDRKNVNLRRVKY
jgi:hypothetical protein